MSRDDVDRRLIEIAIVIYYACAEQLDTKFIRLSITIQKQQHCEKEWEGVYDIIVYVRMRAPPSQSHSRIV